MSCFVVCGCCPLEACSSLMGDGGDVDLGKRGNGGGMGGVEGRDSVVGMYCMIEKIMFS